MLLNIYVLCKGVMFGKQETCSWNSSYVEVCTLNSFLIDYLIIKLV